MGSDRWILSHNAFSRQSSVSKSLANTNPEDIDSGLFFCGNAIDVLRGAKKSYFGFGCLNFYEL